MSDDAERPLPARGSRLRSRWLSSWPQNVGDCPNSIRDRDMIDGVALLLRVTLHDIYISSRPRRSKITTTSAFCRRAVMFSITLQQAEHVKRYSIKPRSNEGWLVTLEEDRTLTRQVWYRDWHRVERAAAMFRLEVAALVSRGWEVRTSTN